MKRTVLKAKDALQLGAALPHGIDFEGKLTEYLLIGKMLSIVLRLQVRYGQPLKIFLGIFSSR